MMSSDAGYLPVDLQSLVQREMSYGGYASSNDLLRDALHYWAEHRDTIRALDEASDQIAAGLGTPLAEFKEEFRKRNGIPSE
ncbi:MAG: hypothetical protein C0483_21435 [Pirellula sp.]|nr:hypothetical protein [Pirellula sp.]